MTGSGREGDEIEIRRRGTAWSGEHVAVRRRQVSSGTTFAAVFPSLAAGHYDLRSRQDAVTLVSDVAVTAAGVTQVDDPTS
jgi:hypothetical protein